MVVIIMKNKLAIFDMDGTLFDTKKSNFMAYRDVLRRYNYDLDYECYSKFCFGKHYKDFLSNILNVENNVIESIHDEKKKLYKEYLSYIKENKQLFNIIKLLKDDYYIALVTTASQENADEILDFYNRKELFDLILTHNDIEKSKPDPEGFNKAISYFNLNVEDTIIFEDSFTGIVAAREVGATVFVVDKF